MKAMIVGAAHVQMALLDCIERGEFADAARILPDLTLGQVHQLRTGAARLTGNTRDGITLVRVGIAAQEGE